MIYGVSTLNSNKTVTRPLPFKGKKARSYITSLLSDIRKNTQKSPEKPPVSIKKYASHEDHDFYKDLKLFDIDSNSSEGEKYETNANLNERKFGPLTNFLFLERFRADSIKINYSKTKILEFLYYKLLTNSLIQCLLSFISILSSVVLYEFEYNNISENMCLAIEVLESAVTFFLLLTIFFEFFVQRKIFSLSQNLSQNIFFEYKNNLRSFVFNILFFLIHPNVLFHNKTFRFYNEIFEIYTTTSINSLLTVFALWRFWFFLKFYLIQSTYYSPRTQRACQMNSINADLFFSLKANMNKTPHILYFLCFFIVLFYCSFCLRIFERDFYIYSGVNLDSYLNCIWCIIVTMTTVGYGDYFPVSTIGRIIGIFACFSGVFLVSMLIVTIHSILTLEGTEKNIFQILQRIHLNKKKDEAAKNLVADYLKTIKILRKENNSEKYQESLKNKVNKRLLQFKDKTNEFDSTFPAYSNYDNVLDNLDFLDSSLANLTQKYNSIEDKISQIHFKLKFQKN